MSDKLIKEKDVIDIVHRVILDLFDYTDDVDEDEEVPMTYTERKYFDINKSITTKIRALPSEEPKWIPVKFRPMDEDERKYYSELYGYDIEYQSEYAVIFDCPMPEDEQEVWVCSKCGNVWLDECVVDDGIGLEGNGDWMDIVAWMPFEKPKPWKGETE